MKQKILEALKTRYAKMGFGQKAFDGVADYLSKTVRKEEDVSRFGIAAGSLTRQS